MLTEQLKVMVIINLFEIGWFSN